MNRKEYIKYLGKSKRNRLRYEFETEKGNVVKLVVQLESLIRGNWIVIVRYDNAHGFFHRDIMLPDGTQDKKEIEIDNLNNALTYAGQDLSDRWEWYKEQYLKTFKS